MVNNRQNLVDVVKERHPAEFDNDFAQAHMQNEKVFWVPTLSASARHYFFMNAGFEWNVLMIKVIKASMRSCLGAFGLGKVAPKLKKGNGSIAIIHLMEVETALCLGFFLFTTQASTSFWKENCLLDSMASSLDVLGCLLVLHRILSYYLLRNSFK